MGVVGFQEDDECGCKDGEHQQQVQLKVEGGSLQVKGKQQALHHKGYAQEALQMNSNVSMGCLAKKM